MNCESGGRKSMSNHTFYVPTLKNAGAWQDLRGRYPGGYGWRGDRPLSAIIKTTEHHSVTDPQGSLIKEADYIKKIHVDGNKWGGIGYHFIISSEVVNGYAKVGYVGDIGSIRAHAPDTKGKYVKAGSGNYYYIGVCIVGQNHQVMPTPEQLRSAHELQKELIFAENKRLPNLKDWNDMVPHKELDYTSCPGMWDKIKPLIIKPSYVEEINKLKKQVKDLTADRNNWKTKAENRSKKITELESKVSDLESKFDNVQNTLNQLSMKVDNLLKVTDSDSIEEISTNIDKLKAKAEQVEEAERVKQTPAYKVALFLLQLFGKSKQDKN